MTDDQFWLLVRQSLLSFLDALERWRGVNPRTAEMRRWAKVRYAGDVRTVHAEDVRARIVTLVTED